MFNKRHPPAGARPGTLVIADDAVVPRMTATLYTPQAIEEMELAGVGDLGPLLEREGILWVDIQGLGDEDLLRELAKLFSVHSLALEDVANAPQRPKTEQYDDHQLYVSRMVTLDENQDVKFEQVSIFVGHRYVLTFQERYGDVLDPVRERLRQGLGPMRKSGADYLGYAIIDTIIDHYYPAIETVTATLDAMEERVMQSPTNETLAIVNRMKRTLLTLRRGVWPQRDAINTLIRDDSPFISETVRVYLRDTHDHIVQVADIIDTYREIAAGLFSTYLSVVGNRTNDVMKVLTIMASIFIPLTFMAGIYGMNFESMPELHVGWAYPLLLLAMAITAGGMLLFFRRKGWLGGGSEHSSP